MPIAETTKTLTDAGYSHSKVINLLERGLIKRAYWAGQYQNDLHVEIPTDISAFAAIEAITFLASERMDEIHIVKFLRPDSDFVTIRLWWD